MSFAPSDKSREWARRVQQLARARSLSRRRPRDAMSDADEKGGESLAALPMEMPELEAEAEAEAEPGARSGSETEPDHEDHLAPRIVDVPAAPAAGADAGLPGLAGIPGFAGMNPKVLAKDFQKFLKQREAMASVSLPDAYAESNRRNVRIVVARSITHPAAQFSGYDKYCSTPLTKDCIRHLVLAIPSDHFEPSSTAYGDIRTGGDEKSRAAYDASRMNMDLFRRLGNKISDVLHTGEHVYRPPADPGQTETTQLAGVAVESGLSPESAATATVKAKVQALLAKTGEGDDAESDQSEQFSKLLANQTSKSCMLHVWRFHIAYVELHPLWAYEWVASSKDPSIARRAGMDPKDFDAKVMRYIQSKGGNLGESVLTRAMRALLADIEANVERLKEEKKAKEKRGGGGTGGRKIELTPAQIKDELAAPPFEKKCRSHRDVITAWTKYNLFYQWKKREVHGDSFEMSPDTDDVRNSWRVSEIYSLEYGLQHGAGQVDESQRDPKKYRGGVFPNKHRVWLWVLPELWNVFNTGFMNRDYTESLGPEYEQTLRGLLQATPSMQDAFIIQWKDEMRRLIGKRYKFNLPSKFADPEKTFRNEAERKADPDEMEDEGRPVKRIRYKDSGANTSEQLRIRAEVLRRAAHDMTCASSLIPRREVDEWTWKDLKDKNKRELADINNFFSKFRQENAKYKWLDDEETEQLYKDILANRQLSALAEVSKFIADAESNKTMSDAHKALCMFYNKFISENHTLYQFPMEKMFNDTSSFAEMTIWFQSLLKSLFQCNRNFPLAHLLFASGMHQYKDCKMSPNHLLTGDQSSGKSFLFECFESLFLKGTVSTVMRVSLQAFQIQRDYSGMLYMMNELDPNIAGAYKAGKNGEAGGQVDTPASAQWKDRLTSNRETGEINDSDPITKQRFTRKVDAEAVRGWWFARNLYTEETLTPALLSRFHLSNLGAPGEYIEKPVSRSAREGKEYDTLDFVKRLQFVLIQVCTFVMHRLSTIACVPGVELTHAENIFHQILDRVSHRGGCNTASERHALRFVANIDTSCVQAACFKSLFLDPNNRRGDQWSMTNFLRIVPHCVVTMEQLRFWLDIHASQFEERVFHQIIRAVREEFMPNPHLSMIFAPLKHQGNPSEYMERIRRGEVYGPPEHLGKPYWTKFMAHQRAIRAKEDAKKMEALLKAADERTRQIEETARLQKNAEETKHMNSLERRYYASEETSEQQRAQEKEEEATTTDAAADPNAADAEQPATSSDPMQIYRDALAQLKESAYIDCVDTPYEIDVPLGHNLPPRREKRTRSRLWVCDPHRLAVNLTADGKVPDNLYTKVNTKIGLYFNKHKLTTAWNQLRIQSVRRPGDEQSQSHFIAFHDSDTRAVRSFVIANDFEFTQHEYTPMELKEKEHARKARGGAPEQVLVIATNYLGNDGEREGDNPVSLACHQVLSHNTSPAVPWIRGFTVHAMSTFFDFDAIPRNPKRVLKYKQTREQSDIELYILKRTAGREEFTCEHGEQCRLDECIRYRYTADNVFLKAVETSYDAKDPDTHSFEHHQKTTGLTDTKLAEMKILDWWMPKKELEYYSGSVTRGYRAQVLSEHKRAPAKRPASFYSLAMPTESELKEPPALPSQAEQKRRHAAAVAAAESKAPRGFELPTAEPSEKEPPKEPEADGHTDRKHSTQTQVQPRSFYNGGRTSTAAARGGRSGSRMTTSYKPPDINHIENANRAAFATGPPFQDD